MGPNCLGCIGFTAGGTGPADPLLLPTLSGVPRLGRRARGGLSSRLDGLAVSLVPLGLFDVARSCEYLGVVCSPLDAISRLGLEYDRHGGVAWSLLAALGLGSPALGVCPAGSPCPLALIGYLGSSLRPLPARFAVGCVEELAGIFHSMFEPQQMANN